MFHDWLLQMLACPVLPSGVVSGVKQFGVSAAFCFSTFSVWKYANQAQTLFTQSPSLSSVVWHCLAEIPVIMGVPGKGIILKTAFFFSKLRFVHKSSIVPPQKCKCLLRKALMHPRTTTDNTSWLGTENSLYAPYPLWSREQHTPLIFHRERLQTQVTDAHRLAFFNRRWTLILHYVPMINGAFEKEKALLGVFNR